MINTHSSFLYGFDVNDDNRYLDVVVSSVAYQVVLDIGSYTADEFISEVQNKLNELQTSVIFTVSLNRSTRIVTISGDGVFDLLVDSGVNAANGAYALLGVPTGSDFLAQTNIVGTSAVGTLYKTQFKLQDFVDKEDNRMARFQTVSKSASGNTTLVKFGNDEMFEFSFKYLTDKLFASGPIRSQINALSNVRSLMRHMVEKKPVEFMPDENSPNTFYKCILDATSASSDGTGYKIEEQYGRGMVGYYEINGVKLRVLED